MIATKDYNFYNFRRNFIIKMVKLGYEVCLVSPYGKKIDVFTERGCSFVNLKIDRRGTNIFNELSLLIQCIRIFRNEKPDLVLTYTTKCSVYPGIACRLLGIKYIVNNAGLVKSSSVLSFILDILYRVAFRGAACMMYQNTEERDYINKLLKNKVKYRDIPGSGVDLDEFSYESYPKEEVEIVFNYVGRIVELKGIKEFLDCAESIKFRYPKTRFVIYGEYDDESYKQRVLKLEQDGIIEHPGTLLDMKPAIKRASAVIHASHYEGMTNVVLEHSSMGRPCIGSDIPGVREGIDDGRTGFLFEPYNVQNLISAVEQFLSMTNAEREEMGKEARKKMEAEFDRNTVTEIYLEEINAIFGSA